MTFEDIVAREIRGNVTHEERQELDDNPAAHKQALTRLIVNLKNQLDLLDEEDRRALTLYKDLPDGTTLIEKAALVTAEKRRKAQGFLFHVENRYAELEMQISEWVPSIEHLAETHDQAFLAQAITAHRELTLAAEIEPSPLDSALWASLQGTWAFDSISPEELMFQ